MTRRGREKLIYSTKARAGRCGDAVCGFARSGWVEIQRGAGAAFTAELQRGVPRPSAVFIALGIITGTAAVERILDVERRCITAHFVLGRTPLFLVCFRAFLNEIGFFG